LEKQNKTAIFTNKGTTSSTEHCPNLYPEENHQEKKGTTEHRRKNVPGKARQLNFHDQEKD
jgi:hypothetical protein